MTTVARREVSALAEQADTLRSLHNGPRPLVLPNAWDVASARLVVKAGFRSLPHRAVRSPRRWDTRTTIRCP